MQYWNNFKLLKGWSGIDFEFVKIIDIVHIGPLALKGFEIDLNYWAANAKYYTPLVNAIFLIPGK